MDALYLKVWQNHRIVNMAVVLVVGVRETEEREILAIDIGASEEEAFCTAFLRGLVGRGSKGVQLVISDTHEGLKSALQKVLTGTAWQHCRVHLMRNVLAHVPKGDKSMVAAARQRQEPSAFPSPRDVTTSRPREGVNQRAAELSQV